MTFKSLRVALLAGVAMAAAAGPAAAQIVDNTVPTLVPVPPDPVINPSGKFSAFDISFADSTLGDIFIGDRSNAGVDIFSGSGLSLITRAGGFAGVQPPPSRRQQQHFRPGWRFDGHLGRGHNPLRR